jgi:hypothetical protein
MATAEQIAAVYQAADAAGVPRDLFFRLVKQESAFRPDVWGGQRRSSAGAIGPAQLMPGTAAELGVDPYDINANLLGGARYLRQQLDTFGDPALALAAYNAGPGRVWQAGGVPNIEETQNYVRTILGDTAPAPQNALAGMPAQSGFTPSQDMDPQMMQMNALAALNRARPQYQGNALDASAFQQNARNFMV